MTVALGRFPLDTRGGYWGLLHSLRENDAPTLPEDEFSPTIVDFIRRMMAKDPAKRSTAADLLKHPFVAKCKPPPQTNSEPPPNVCCSYERWPPTFQQTSRPRKVKWTPAQHATNLMTLFATSWTTGALCWVCGMMVMVVLSDSRPGIEWCGSA